MNIIFINSESLFNSENKILIDTIININLLRYHSKCKFVLIDETNKPLYKLEDEMHRNGVSLRPIDIVPNINAEKGHRVNIWLQNNKYDKFVIIDNNIDDIENWYNDVVKIDSEEGFTKMKMKTVLSLFGEIYNIT